MAHLEGAMRLFGFTLMLVSVGIAACSEKVDAYFYPDRSDLTRSESFLDVGSVEACRDWAYYRAAQIGDPAMRRSTYECGIGPRQRGGSFTVYRETVQ
jgi:hypothetical protein